MKYLCLAYLDGAETDASDEMDAGVLLHPVQSAATIRVRGGKVSVIDAPVANAEPPLRAFCVLDARDLNDAIRLAAKLPEASRGYIEVRPIAECCFSKTKRDFGN